jgi:hypothetical protein
MKDKARTSFERRTVSDDANNFINVEMVKLGEYAYSLILVHIWTDLKGQLMN